MRIFARDPALTESDTAPEPRPGALRTRTSPYALIGQREVHAAAKRPPHTSIPAAARRLPAHEPPLTAAGLKESSGIPAASCP